MTYLGREYADLPQGPEKEAKLLEILRSFHGYLMKYVKTILVGHLPMERGGPKGMRVNKDTHLLLHFLVPKEQLGNRAALGAACRTLHLAFKGMNADEIYDQLMTCLVAAIKRYDPYYLDKVKATVEAIREPLKEQSEFSAAEISTAIGYEGGAYLRLLVRKGYLATKPIAVGREALYTRTEQWPVPDSMFQNGPIGLSYVATKWFRLYLIDFIHFRMSELEAKEGVMQLGIPDLDRGRNGVGVGEAWTLADRGLPHTEGNVPNKRTGKRIAADLSMETLPVDIGHMNLDWVNESRSGLFEDLTKRERRILYCVFVCDMNWESLGATLGVNAREAKRQYADVLGKLQRKLALLPASGRRGYLKLSC